MLGGQVGRSQIASRRHSLSTVFSKFHVMFATGQRMKEEICGVSSKMQDIKQTQCIGDFVNKASF